MAKLVFWGIISICTGIGSWVPTLWHAGMFSVAGIIGGLVGAGIGFWVNSLLNNYINP